MRILSPPCTSGGPAAAIAAYGLAGSGSAMPSQPLDGAAWSGLRDQVTAERLVGFLASAIADGAFPVTAEQSRQSQRLHVTSMRVALVLEAMLLRVGDLFEARGIDYRVLKGSAYAHICYPAPSYRSFGDVDLLVRSHDFDAAVATLLTVGARRRYPEPRPGFDRRFSKGASFVLPDGLELDLHRTFVSGPYGLTIDLPSLFTTMTEFDIAGRSLAALGSEERFVHACFHAVLGHAVPRLLALRDVAQILLHEPLDTARVHAMAVSWQCEIVVAVAIVATWSRFELSDQVSLSIWAEGFEPSRDQLRLLNLYTGSTRSYAGQSIAAVRAIPGMRNKLSYVQAIANPRRLVDEHSRLERWRRGLHALARRGRAPNINEP